MEKEELLKMKKSIETAEVLFIDSYLSKKFKIIDNKLLDNFIIESEFYDIPKIEFNSNKITNIKKINKGEWEIYFYIQNMEEVYSIIKTMKLIPYEK